jgi:hypothetical protein
LSDRFALVVAYRRDGGRPHFVDEDDARRAPAQQIADARDADADEHLDEAQLLIEERHFAAPRAPQRYR